MPTLREILEENQDQFVQDNANEPLSCEALLEELEASDAAESDPEWRCLDNEYTVSPNGIHKIKSDGFMETIPAYEWVDPVEESFLNYDFDTFVSDAEEAYEETPDRSFAEIHKITSGNGFFSAEDLSKHLAEGLNKYDSQFNWESRKSYGGFLITASKK